MSVSLDIKGGLTEIQNNVVECISIHFTDIYFNYLYLQAVALRDKNSEIQSITDGYKAMIKTYGAMIGRPEFVRESIQGIHKQFREFINVSIISSYEDCINSILNIFLTEPGYKETITDHTLRNQLIATVIHRIANATIVSIIQRFLNRIIDERTPRTVADIQNHLVDDIVQVAFDMHQEVKSQGNDTGTRVDRVLMEKLHEECKRAIIEKMELTKKLVALETIVRNKMQKITELEEHIAQLNLRLEGREQTKLPVGQTSTLHLPPIPEFQRPSILESPPRIVEQKEVLVERRPRRDLSAMISPPRSVAEPPAPTQQLQPSPTRSVAKSASVRYDEEQGASNIINRTIESVNSTLFA